VQLCVRIVTLRPHRWGVDHLLQPERLQRRAVQGCPERLLPVAATAKGGATQAESVAAIYADYRNPLAHAWAISTKEVGKHPNKRIIMDGSAKVLGVVKQALTEKAVAALEASTGRAPSWLTPVVVRNAAGGV
jgi:hypothetical protein